MIHRFAPALLAAAFAGAASAQDTLTHPVGEIVPFAYDSGFRDNPDDQPKIVDAQVLTPHQNAAWLRAYFEHVSLPTGSFVRVISFADAETQVLDLKTMEDWSHSSAYFNGNTIAVELVAAPRSVNNRFAIHALGMEINRNNFGDPGQCGICGSDDRTPSTTPWSGRIMPVGCTGSIYCSTGSGMVTAGHCLDGQSNLVMHFNVPASNSNCSTVAPPVNDQFPILPGFQYVNGGVGNDWGVYRTGTNGLGQTPLQRYGSFAPIAPSPATTGATSNIWGFGVDTTCVRSQTQQFSPGNVNSVTSTYYTFTNDIRGGNSGSGFLNAAGQLIGVVTHCSTAGCPGYATRIDLPSFVTGRAAVGCTPPPPPANDNCANAIPVTLGSVSGTTIGATPDGSEGCTGYPQGGDVWYAFTPSCGGTYRFSTCSTNTNYDSVLSIHTGCPGTTANAIACNDDAGAACTTATHSQIDAALAGGVTYLVRVSGWNQLVGNFTLTTSSISVDGTPVTISQHPANAIACPGEAFTVAAAAAGSTPLAFQWQVQTAPNTWLNLTTSPAGLPCGGTARASAPTSPSSQITIAGCSGTFSVRAQVSNVCGSAPTNPAVITLRAPGDPLCASCDTDYNGDGNTDQDDVAYLINVVGGGSNPTGMDPDFNGDGNISQDDIIALINVIAGGACP